MEPISTVAAAVAVIAAKSGIEAFGSQVGRGAVAALVKLRQLVKDKLHGDSAGEGALELAQQRPEDAEALAVLAAVLQEYMTRDAMFAEVLETLATELGSDESVSGRINIHAGTVKAVFNAKVEVKQDFIIN